MVSEWGSARSSSDSNGKRPLSDVVGRTPVSGVRSTAMGQKPRETGHLPQRDGQGDGAETPGNGASGNIDQVPGLPLRGERCSRSLFPQTFSNLRCRARRRSGGDDPRPARARVRGGGYITVASRSRGRQASLAKAVFNGVGSGRFVRAWRWRSRRNCAGRSRERHA